MLFFTLAALSALAGAQPAGTVHVVVCPPDVGSSAPFVFLVDGLAAPEQYKGVLQLSHDTVRPASLSRDTNHAL